MRVAPGSSKQRLGVKFYPYDFQSAGGAFVHRKRCPILWVARPSIRACGQ